MFNKYVLTYHVRISDLPNKEIKMKIQQSCLTHFVHDPNRKGFIFYTYFSLAIPIILNMAIQSKKCNN